MISKSKQTKSGTSETETVDAKGAPNIPKKSKERTKNSSKGFNWNVFLEDSRNTILSERGNNGSTNTDSEPDVEGKPTYRTSKITEREVFNKKISCHWEGYHLMLN
ncbi:hypothetical protein O181_081242 [Austropuccinia psidii MF-1]|uniref:Uncharacterized protein n=1 Tax=Austropuccinia psidii MF-1 TaxID=1389203 RepID=A0A9Q3II66_9BASI|nr:hypothetical protein [Austropuccinia psidii MF-1]